MKLLVLLFLVGCASAASLYDVYDSHGFELQANEIESADFDIREIFEKLKDSINSKIDKEKLVEKVEELFGKGSEIAESLLNFVRNEKTRYKEKLLDLIDRFLGYKDRRSVQNVDFNLRELFQKLKESISSKIDKERLIEKVEELFGKGSEIAKSLLNSLKDEKSRYEMREKLLDLIDRYLLGYDKDSRRSVQNVDFNLRELFQKLKKSLLSKVDKEKVKEKVEQLFGKGSEMADALLEIINEKGDKYKQKLLDLIDRYLGKDKRSLSDYWQKVKDYFKDLKIDLQEKYMKFGEWVKEVVSKGLDKGKGKVENIRQIAREFIDHAKGVSKEVAVEALEFLRPYKEDLGNLYDQVKDTVKDVLNRKD